MFADDTVISNSGSNVIEIPTYIQQNWISKKKLWMVTFKWMVTQVSAESMITMIKFMFMPNILPWIIAWYYSLLGVGKDIELWAYMVLHIHNEFVRFNFHCGSINAKVYWSYSKHVSMIHSNLLIVYNQLCDTSLYRKHCCTKQKQIIEVVTHHARAYGPL